MKRVGLFFGTFNPIHVGHLIIANFMADLPELDEVWLVVTPRNPHKKKDSLLRDHHRLQLARVATEDNFDLDVSRIEFDLPQPCYTINTLKQLEEKHTEHRFTLIVGEDNLRTFHKWKNYEEILKGYELFIYPRAYTVQERDEGPDPKDKEREEAFKALSNVHLFDAPVMKISASFIRKAIAEGRDVRYLLTPPVHQYVKEMHFYES
ncbi:MAG: nicotinate (nicotinamide) nucleotide adenylyltransferase [Flavobacteriales bacterium]